MIISENKKPAFEEFKALMTSTDDYLNRDAESREKYYTNRDGSKLEEDVYSALVTCSKGTPFEGSISLVSGSSFPDIVAHKYYGVEVKSTVKNHWKSIGSSILESTRISDVEKIFLTFGKLGKPVQFKSRPYEEVLAGISVTHYPRYQIDMELNQGDTIFDRIGIPYDDLRLMDNPVAPVSEYYRRQLKRGQSLWWAPGTKEELEAPPILRLWSSLDTEQKNELRVKGYALFPEVLGDSSIKYQRFALWMVQSCSVVITNVRDLFSAGGKVTVKTENGIFERMPAVFGRINKYSERIKDIVQCESTNSLIQFWQTPRIEDNRIDQWCRIAAKESAENSTLTYEQVYIMLCGIFGNQPKL